MTAKKGKRVIVDKPHRESQAAKQPQRHSARIAKKAKVSWNFPLSRKNFIYAAIGLGVIILGYALMATGITNDPATVEGTWNNPLAISVAPLLLVIGYCVLIPLAIIKFFKKEEAK